jgi:hypothetical protein
MNIFCKGFYLKMKHAIFGILLLLLCITEVKADFLFGSQEISLFGSNGIATSSPTYSFESQENDKIGQYKSLAVQYHYQLCFFNIYNRPIIGFGFAFELNSSKFKGNYNGRMHSWAFGYDFRFLMIFRYQFLFGECWNNPAIRYYFNEGDHYNSIDTNYRKSGTWEYRYGLDIPIFFQKNISVSIYRFSKRFGPSRKYNSDYREPKSDRYRGNIKGYMFGLTYSFDLQEF